jgi:hypothetical protein
LCSLRAENSFSTQILGLRFPLSPISIRQSTEYSKLSKDNERASADHWRLPSLLGTKPKPRHSFDRREDDKGAFGWSAASLESPWESGKKQGYAMRSTNRAADDERGAGWPPKSLEPSPAQSIPRSDSTQLKNKCRYKTKYRSSWPLLFIFCEEDRPLTMASWRVLKPVLVSFESSGDVSLDACRRRVGLAFYQRRLMLGAVASGDVSRTQWCQYIRS